MNRKSIVLTALLMGVFLMPRPLMATVNVAQNSAAPIEISAGQALEWRQKELQYIARGDVVITQGDMQVKADEVIADYKTGANDKTEIWRLTASGNVIINDAENTIIGDKGVYIIEGGIASMTGANLKLTAPNHVITASQKMEYASDKGTASAVGNAKVISGDETLTASRMDVTFIKDSAGKNQLSTITASGGVTIKTPLETLKGNNGIYNAQKQTARVNGNVVITRGPNSLKGERADVDLKTKVSKIFGDEKTGERVKGVFFPGSAPQ